MKSRKADEIDMNALKMTGISDEITSVNNFIDKISKLDFPVLIEGQPGTGKNYAARVIYNNSSRKEKPYICVDCGADSLEVIEKGLFEWRSVISTASGQIELKKELLKELNGGTLVIDQVEKLDRINQNRLLKVLENEKYNRGQFRIILISNEKAESGDGKTTTEELRRYISTFKITLPSLNERTVDISYLVNEINQEYKTKTGTKKTFDIRVLEEFENYTWRGNVGELKSVIECTIALSESESIYLNDLPKNVLDHLKVRSDGKVKNVFSDFLPIDKYMDKAEEEYLKKVYKMYPNKSELAKVLKVSRAKLYRMLEKHGVL